MAASHTAVMTASAAFSPAKRAPVRPTSRPTDTKFTEPPEYVPVSAPAIRQVSSPNCGP